MESYKDAAHLAATLKPINPVFCARPHAADAAARAFLRGFDGETFYAVKANPSLWLLQALYDAGVRNFEVVSIAETRLIRGAFSDARIAFMNPVKAEEAIAEAYHQHGVRIFALDTEEELDKIVRVAGGAADLTLCLRHRVNNADARINLGAKFGAEGDVAVSLLQRMRQVCERLGVCFHVGSQAMSPASFSRAIDAVEQTIVRAGVIIDVLNVGGGFPVAYPGMTPPSLETYFAVIHERFEAMLVAENCALWCEPGRALSAEAASLLVRVEARKNSDLYINDGAYGALFDAAHLNWRFPARRVSGDDAQAGPTEAFRFYGPTCDDLDCMEGPFDLPASTAVGDYLEIDCLGAYGAAMATGFNGFGGDYLAVCVEDGDAQTGTGVANVPGNEQPATAGGRYGI
ncbi:MAG: type III PLP-dependent enzyme [Pseudomonadota bacterium]